MWMLGPIGFASPLLLLALLALPILWLLLRAVPPAPDRPALGAGQCGSDGLARN